MSAEIMPFQTRADAEMEERSRRLDALKAALPFVVKKRKRGKRGPPSFWSVTSSGDYVADLEEGKRFARLFLPILEYNLGPAMLAWIVLDMIRAGDDEKSKGLVIGFISEIGRYGSAGAWLVATYGGGGDSAA
jgi:hypothetical protein